jgi:DNA-binding response OmpR family regulator
MRNWHDVRMRILIAEDEPLIASFIEKGLAAEGHAIEVAVNGPSAIGIFLAAPADLVILDVMLPGCDGFEVLQQIRQVDPLVPVIMLTARGEVDDRVRGLDLGATDYMVKPFAFAELAARVRSHLRTVDRAGAAARSDIVEVGDLRLDLLRREVLLDDEPVALSAREFALLEYLMRHRGQVLSRQQILDGVWGISHDPRSNVIDVYIRYLRTKLRDEDASRIETVRGMGYRLVDR